MKLSDIKVGDSLHEFKFCHFSVGPRGGIEEYHRTWKVTRIQTWKRDPDRFRITIHRGLREWEYITREDELVYLCSGEDCPAQVKSAIWSGLGLQAAQRG